uniref:Uncharacterized protein n=1 Tax=Anguilla anguilla TaxID=7936 RepID=A0A0E9TWQ4_ANGAN
MWQPSQKEWGVGGQSGVVQWAMSIRMG